MRKPVWYFICVAGWLAALLCAIFFPPGRRSEEVFFESASAGDPGGRPVWVDLRAVQTFSQFVDAVGRAYGVPVVVQQELVPYANGTPFPSLGLQRAEMGDVFRRLNVAAVSIRTLDWRRFPDHLEIATDYYFDQIEVATVNYDVADIVRRMAAAESPPGIRTDYAKNLREVITTTVCPTYWVDNGGELASMQMLGSGLIITAPGRMHPKIRWIIDQASKHPGLYSEAEIKSLTQASGAGTKR